MDLSAERHFNYWQRDNAGVRKGDNKNSSKEFPPPPISNNAANHKLKSNMQSESFIERYFSTISLDMKILGKFNIT